MWSKYYNLCNSTYKLNVLPPHSGQVYAFNINKARLFAQTQQQKSHFQFISAIT